MLYYKVLDKERFIMIYVVGHRGAAGVEPENTIRGFRYALELGVDYVECDVHLTKDNQLIVMHDETVDRTTNGTGAIRNLTFAEIRSLDAGKGERVPTLTEVLEVVKDKAILLIELKGEGVEENAVQTVKEKQMDKQVIFTSFHLDRIRQVKNLASSLKVGAIFGKLPSDSCQQALRAGASGIGVHYRNLRQELVEEAHRHGLDVRAWNPDTVPEMQAMIDLGVDGVSSNRPDLLISLVRGSR
jgi:glycerophosphoryl diester phosphodiesterase